MDGFWVGFLSAFWLGILTSISPCPLATNVATISFLAKRITHPFFVLISGIAYTFGRMCAYAVLGYLLINSILAVPQSAQFLQKYMTKALGPILIITGLILLEVITLRIPGVSLSQKHQNKLVESGAFGAFALGFIFSLAFCPVSAALFFGSLISLALKAPLGSGLPFIYGVGTGLPVMIFAVVIALGLTSLSRWFNRLTKIEYFMRKATGIIFILVGIYYSGVYILRIF
ncbi:MAG: aromatic aminobenezylarsenical efflux permease ArsG family transporter [Candidatus Omnitrophota bacterium]